MSTFESLEQSNHYNVPAYLFDTPVMEGSPLDGSASSDLFRTPKAFSSDDSPVPFSTYFTNGPMICTENDTFNTAAQSSSSSLNKPIRFAFSNGGSEGIPQAKVKPSCPLPTSWNTRDKCSLLELSNGGRKVAYTGSGKSDADAAAVRANAPMPQQAGIYYYEVKILSKGRDGYIGIGFCGQTVSINRLPGWEQNSWGYHGDDGHSFACSGTGKSYGPTFTTGDVIGCGVDFANRCAFYTKNGIHLGIAFRDIKAGLGLFPSVGLRTPGEAIEANFGREPFVFDIQQFFDEQRHRLWDKITTLPLEPPVSFEALVLDYLKHHSYVATANQFARDCGSFGLCLTQKELPFAKVDFAEGLPELDSLNDRLPADEDETADTRQVEAQSMLSESDISSMQERRQLRDLIVDGKVEDALSIIERLAPQLPEKYPHILFALKSIKYTQLVAEWVATKQKEGTDSPASAQMLLDIVAFGQKLLAEYGDTQNQFLNSELGDLFSLLAYSDPQGSPVAYLLDAARRKWLANDVNSAILSCSGGASDSLLAKLLRHAGAVRSEMVSNNFGSASFLNLKKDIFERPKELATESIPTLTFPGFPADRATAGFPEEMINFDKCKTFNFSTKSVTAANENDMQF